MIVDPNPDTCTVCGETMRYAGGKCECPWWKPLCEWPRALQNTLRAIAPESEEVERETEIRRSW